ncbi:MAG: ribose-phosphate pyrophosphokinase [Candidatus Ratteibacteria bacterium]|jgi:ribose-phosphate pyrophosphokinase
MNNCLIFSGSANTALSTNIVRYLEKDLGKMSRNRFSDGEISIAIEENVRGKDVFVVQSSSPPVNENLMELLIMIDAFRRASAERITAVIPYFGYARQDRKDKPRVPITAKLVANLLTASGVNRVITMDLHAPQIQGFFDIPVDHLFAAPVTTAYFQKKGVDENNLVVVAPDVGSVKMARAFAKKMRADLAIVDKRRDGPDEVEVVNLIGNVRNKTAILVDDLISTGGTIVEAAEVLKKNGAVSVYASCTHGVLCGNAIAKIKSAPLKELVITDTIPLSPENNLPVIKVLSVAEMLGEAIKRIHLSSSVSSLFI